MLLKRFRFCFFFPCVEKDADEPPLANYFGPFSSGLKKGCGLLSLSFLDNDDIYNACLVSRGWSQLAMDPALWEAATAT